MQTPHVLIAAPAFALMLLSSAASAQDCNPRATANTVSGTLTSPQAPCRPSAHRPSQDQPRKKEPGVVRHGNTTIHVGGAILGDVTIRGR
jgi:hypothetical protein